MTKKPASTKSIAEGWRDLIRLTQAIARVPATLSKDERDAAIEDQLDAQDALIAFGSPGGKFPR
jgi:hypothetical protein